MMGMKGEADRSEGEELVGAALRALMELCLPPDHPWIQKFAACLGATDEGGDYDYAGGEGEYAGEYEAGEYEEGEYGEGEYDAKW